MPAVPRIPLESPASSEMNEEDESPDADYDLEDYDSEEEKRKKKRRPPPKSNRSSGGGVAPPRPSRSSDVANDKPFHCSGKVAACSVNISYLHIKSLSSSFTSKAYLHIKGLSSHQKLVLSCFKLVYVNLCSFLFPHHLLSL